MLGDKLYTKSENGKLVKRPGRKITGLRGFGAMTAGSPDKIARIPAQDFCVSLVILLTLI
jgi:hypothetical protein